ncbi:hypothetical protein TB2_040245 [Malus domestica]
MEAMVAYRQLSVPLAMYHLLEAHNTVWGNTSTVLAARISMINEHSDLLEKLFVKMDDKDDCCGGYEACYFAHQTH